MKLDRSDATPVLMILIGAVVGLPGLLALRSLSEDAPDVVRATTVVQERVTIEEPRDPQASRQEACPRIAVSPDGRWVAYVLAQGDRREVVVRSLPDVTDQRVGVPPGVSCVPVWSPDGREVLYLSRDGISVADFGIDADGRVTISSDVERPEPR